MMITKMSLFRLLLYLRDRCPHRLILTPVVREHDGEDVVEKIRIVIARAGAVW